MIKRFAFADDRERQMGQRSEIATGANRTFFGNDGRDAALEQREQSFNHDRTRAAQALRQNVRTQQQHCPRLGL